VKGHINVYSGLITCIFFAAAIEPDPLVCSRQPHPRPQPL